MDDFYGLCILLGFLAMALLFPAYLIQQHRQKQKAKTTPPPLPGLKAKRMKLEHAVGIGCAVLLAVPLLVGGGCYLLMGYAEKAAQEAPKPVELVALVTYDGAQFTITNGNNFSWDNVKLELNGKTFSSGYVLNAQQIAPQSTYTVGAMQFANSDGLVFNPFTHKPLSISISCDTRIGKAFYNGTWK
jgi:hypothetical protein